MKRLIYSPAALSSIEDILEWTVETLGDAQAERYRLQLAGRLRLLASGEPPYPRNCSGLFQNRLNATDLSYHREGRHYLILRETAETLEIVEVLHAHMDIEARLDELRTAE